MVKVRYDEGLTNHVSPESCVAVRDGGCEALTGVRAGHAIERKYYSPGSPMRYLPQKATRP
jgi:hypothetical protein